jgi:hypothetical protein
MKLVSFIVPDGDFQITSFGDALTTSGIRSSELHIVDVDRRVKRWVRDPDTGQAVIDDVSVGEYLSIGYGDN